jgi:hypothetical protein
MIIKLPYEKLKEILYNERAILYSKYKRRQVFELLHLKDILNMKCSYSENRSMYSRNKTSLLVPESNCSDDFWIVKKDPLICKSNDTNEPLYLAKISLKSIDFFNENKSRLDLLKDYKLTEFDIECDINFLEEVKKNESNFKHFDEYFKKYIGDIKDLDLEEEIKSARELKELEIGT